jgi:hypothetical protein
VELYFHLFIRLRGKMLLFLLKDYHLFMERRFAGPSDPESYAGGSVSSW